MKIIHELINLGKGKYGNGHTQIEVADLLKIYDQREASTSTGGSGGGTTITTEGHVILDGNASIMTQQPNLRFNRMIVTNDNVNQQTIVTRPPSIILSTTPPLNPLQGDEWINSNTWKTYVYYDSYWVEQSRTGLGDQLFKPVLNSYTTQSLMIAGQGSQISGYLYYDGTSYWEYLGTTNGNITDYREVGGGSITPGLGLSLDSLNRIQLGTEDYVGNRTIVFDEWQDTGYSEFVIRNSDSSNSLLLYNDSTSKGLYYNSFLTGGNDFVELSVGSGQVYISRAIMDGPTQKTQLLIFDTAIQNNRIIFRDDINLKGVEYLSDYESNFTARSLVTKQYVDNAISGSTGGGHTIKLNDTPLTQRAGLNFSTSFIVTDDSVNNETDVTIDTNIIATRSYVDGITAQYSAATKLYLFNNY